MHARQDDPSLEPEDIPVAPSAEVWRSMSEDAQLAFILAATDALNERNLQLMGEGRPHERARAGAMAVLGDFFERAGQPVYLASDLPVLYPGEPVFAPDLIAVIGVEDPRDADTRSAWSVVGEGQGIDLALEILYKGDRQKDLVRNVIRFARLGITEYLVYDRLKQRLLGYRLHPTAARYDPIPVRAGRISSRVLNLELAISGGRLRFYSNGAPVPEVRELLAHANEMIDESQSRLEAEEQARLAAEAAKEQAEAAREQAEAAREQAEAAREQAEAAKEQAEAAKEQAEAAKEQAEAAKEQAEAARDQAEAAKEQAEAAKEQAERRADAEAAARAALEAELAELRRRLAEQG
jgi:Uma2 family endonuclease